MATIYRTDGVVIQVRPAGGGRFTYAEVKDIVGGIPMIYPLPSPSGSLVLFEEDSIDNRALPFNEAFNSQVQSWALRGDVIVMTEDEIEEWDDDEDDDGWGDIFP